MADFKFINAIFIIYLKAGYDYNTDYNKDRWMDGCIIDRLIWGS